MTKKRAIRTNPFQSLIAAIEKSLAGEDIVVTESALIIDKSTGKGREVDVLIEGRVNKHEISIAVECRDYKGRQDVEWIDDLVGKYKNLPVDQIVAVSSSGFTKEAIKRGSFEGIKLLSFVDALSADWAKIINGRFEVSVVHPRFIPQGIRVVASTKGGMPKRTGPVAEMAVSKRGKIIGSVISLLAQGLPEVMPKLREQLYSATSPKLPPRTPIVIPFETVLTIHDAFLIDAEGDEFPLKEIIVECNLIYDVNHSPADVFNYDNQAVIHAIMELGGKNIAVTTVQSSPDEKPKQVHIIVDEANKNVWRPRMKMKKQ
jgi:hypothetical protein